MYVGKTCGQKVYPVPSYKLDDTSILDSSKILTPGKTYVGGANFGPTNSKALEPGMWEYFVVDTRGSYNSIQFKMTITNNDVVQNSGVLAPLLLVKSAEGGGK